MEKKVLVNVGSGNPAKIKAVESAFRAYGFEPRVSGISVESGVHRQPKTIEEIATGARNRARNSYSKECDFSVGLESGIFPFPEETSGYVVLNCATVFDGKKFFSGVAPGFVCPPKIVKRLLAEDIELGQAVDEIVKEKNVKQRQGIIGILTNGVMGREKLTELGVIMALCQVVNKKFYE